MQIATHEQIKTCTHNIHYTLIIFICTHAHIYVQSTHKHGANMYGMRHGKLNFFQRRPQRNFAGGHAANSGRLNSKSWIFHVQMSMRLTITYRLTPASSCVTYVQTCTKKTSCSRVKGQTDWSQYGTHRVIIENDTASQ